MLMWSEITLCEKVVTFTDVRCSLSMCKGWRKHSLMVGVLVRKLEKNLKSIWDTGLKFERYRNPV